jgi:hypothetical protein
MKSNDWVRKLGPTQLRNLGPVQRFAVWAAFGVFTAFGMWVISVLSHADKFGLGLSWQDAVAFVVYMGILCLASRRKRSQRTLPQVRHPDTRGEAIGEPLRRNLTTCSSRRGPGWG